MKNTLYITILLILNQLLCANEPPYFVTDPVLIVTEFEVYSYQVVATDPDSEDSLYYIIKEKPDWLIFTDFGNDTALLTGSPDQYYDENPVTLAVTDGIDTIYQEYSISIACLNCGPVITTLPVTQVIAYDHYNSFVEATDCVGDVIFSIDTLPDWLSFDNSADNMAIFDGIPSNADAGSHNVSFFAEREFSVCPTKINLVFVIEVLPVMVSNENDESINNLPRVFPNPANDILIFQNNNPGISTMKIYNSLGQLCLEKEISGSRSEINISTLREGLFIVEIKNDRNKFNTVLIKK